MDKAKKKRSRSAKPVERAKPKSRRKKPSTKDAKKTEGKGPIYVRPADGSRIHEALEHVLATRPFLATIYINDHGLSWPVGPGQAPAKVDGLHRRMLFRFFRGQELNNTPSDKAFPKHKRSSMHEGSRADAALAECIRTGLPPPPAHHPGTSVYAAGVWEYWRQHHHRPVLAQLPVVILHAYTATAGDYFTVHTCPFTKKETLCLWELKTGYPKEPKRESAPSMTIPMPPLVEGGAPEEVPLTPVNRYYLQVLLTQMAYERELGLRVDGTVRVINAYMERQPRVNGRPPQYKCRVRVIGPDDLEPKGWPNRVLRDALYLAIRKQ